MFNKLTDDLVKPFYFDDRSISEIIQEKEFNQSLGIDGLESVFDRYFMLPLHGGVQYNLADVATIHHTTQIIEEI